MLKPGEKTQLTTRSNDTRGIANTEGGISGLKGVRDLSYKLIFTAVNIKVENNQFDDFKEEKDEDEVEEGVKEVFEEHKIWDKILGGLDNYVMNII